MNALILAIHIIAAIVMIVLVLIQHGKGADIGATLGGGASQTVFGSGGSTPFLVKLTVYVAVLFFAANIVLNYLTSRHNNNFILQHSKAADVSESMDLD